MFLFTLLQMTVSGTTTDSGAVSAAQLPAVQETAANTMSYWSMLVKGGPVMLAIALLSVGLVYLFVERLMVIRKAGKLDANLMNGVKNLINKGDLEGAKHLCRSSASPVARMIEKGISRLGQPIMEIESAMETAGKVELNRIEKNMGYLSTIAAIAPMFGFVGTIFGVIAIFFNISQSGDFGIQTISAGLYQKMVTSAAGLIIGIIAFVCHHLLHNKVEALISQMEEASMQFIDMISEPGK